MFQVWGLVGFAFGGEGGARTPAGRVTPPTLASLVRATRGRPMACAGCRRIHSMMKPSSIGSEDMDL